MEDFTMDERRKLIAMGLWFAGAVKFGEFHLKLHRIHPDQPKSPVYIDLALLGGSVTAWLIAPRIEAAYDEFETQTIPPRRRIAIISRGATPIARDLRYSQIIQIEETQTWDPEKNIIGDWKKSQHFAALGDLTTTGDSKLRSIGRLRQTGLKIHDLLLIVDREQYGAVKRLREAGLFVQAVFKLSELVRFYAEIGIIPESDLTRTLDYLAVTQNPLPEVKA